MHEVQDMPPSVNRFYMLVHPGTPQQTRIPFSLSECDIERAIEDGMANAGDGLFTQLADTAYYMVVTRRVCQDTRLLSAPWVVVHNGVIVGRNARAANVTIRDVS
jgi:hypothetical protein